MASQRMRECDLMQHERVSKGNTMRLFRLIVQHGEELHCESTGGIHQLTPKLASLPPAPIGGVGTKGEEDGQRRCQRRNRQSVQRDPPVMEDGVDGSDGAVKDQENEPSLPCLWPDSFEGQFVSNNHVSVPYAD